MTLKEALSQPEVRSELRNLVKKSQQDGINMSAKLIKDLSNSIENIEHKELLDMVSEELSELALSIGKE